jgi:hypothetical protein
MGSAVDSAFDFAGDVIGGAGDLVGDAIETVADNPELLALVAVPYLAPEMFAFDALAAEGLGGVGAFDVASSALPGLTFDAATGAYTLADAGLGLGLGTEAGGSLFSDLVNADAFDPTSFLPGNNPYDPIRDVNNYTNYAKDAYKVYNMLNPDSQSQVQNQFANQGLYNPSSGEFDYSNILGQFIDQGQNAYNTYNLINRFSNLDPTNFNPVDILGNLASSGLKELTTLPGALATGFGVLSIYDQKRVNNLIQQGYDKEEAKKLVKEQQYTTPAGIASLPKQNITGLTPRTAADVVVKPQAAKGGYINDLYNEYSELNNRMRNYRRLAKGGIV